MKIGFLDCIMNAADVFEVATRVANERIASVDVSRYTSPDVLKIPASAKKLFQGGADVVIVFLTAIQEDHEALMLVYEKTIDVEIEYGKFVFFCIVGEDEWSKREDIPKAAELKLTTVMDLVAKTVQSPSQLSEAIGSDAYSAFAQMTAAALGTPAQDSSSQDSGSSLGGMFEGGEGASGESRPLF
jgi:riboflavin synthase